MNAWTWKFSWCLCGSLEWCRESPSALALQTRLQSNSSVWSAYNQELVERCVCVEFDALFLMCVCMTPASLMSWICIPNTCRPVCWLSDDLDEMILAAQAPDHQLFVRFPSGSTRTKARVISWSPWGISLLRLSLHSKTDFYKFSEFSLIRIVWYFPH